MKITEDVGGRRDTIMLPAAPLRIFSKRSSVWSSSRRSFNQPAPSRPQPTNFPPFSMASAACGRGIPDLKSRFHHPSGNFCEYAS
jgi:hypothetical protein